MIDAKRWMTAAPVSAGLDTMRVAYALRPGTVAMARTEQGVFMSVNNASEVPRS